MTHTLAESDTGRGAFRYYGPSMAVAFLFLGVGLSAKSLWTERRLGLVARQLAGPTSYWQLLLGIGGAGCILGAGSVAVLWAGTFAVGSSWGPVAPVAALLVCMVAAALAFAVLLGALASSEERIETLVGLFGFLFALVGGNLIHFYRLPESLRSLAVVTPNGWAMRAFADMQAGAGAWSAVGPACAAILAFAVIGLTGGYVLSARRFVS